MRFRNIFFLFILITGFTFSQVTNEGQPVSWTLNLETDNIQEKLMPSFDMQRVAAEDAENDGVKGIPWKDLKDIALGLVDKGLIEVHYENGIPIVDTEKLESIEIKLGREVL